MRITDSVALDCAQEAAGQLRYEIEAAFSQGLPNTPMAGATGAGDLGQLHHRAPGGPDRRRGLPAFRPGAQGGHRRHPAHAGHGRAGADFAVRLFAHRRGLQPEHGRRGHLGGHGAAERQADLPHRSAGHPRRQPTTRRARSTPSCRWPMPSAWWPACRRQPSPPTPRFYLQHCIRACEGRRRAQPHHPVCARRLAAAGDLRARRHRHHGGGRKAGERARGHDGRRERHPGR